MNILGIETSCDETAAAVVADGRTVRSSVVASQVAIHRPYGGVVPELASRNHLEKIVPVVQQALAEAKCSLKEIAAVAVTRGPGLVGALLTGFSFAKALAYARGLPLVGVDHLDGHISSVFLADHCPSFPFIALLASGGHTAVYYVTSRTEAALMGQTRDDAAGEAYDKVAKMMGLGYPGGSIIDEYAARGDPDKVTLPRPYLDKAEFDFSFSGLKTAVGRYVTAAGNNLPEVMPDIAAGFQEAVADVLCYKLIHAARVKQCRDIALVGGVAANRRIREKLLADAGPEGLRVYIPPEKYCADNAAMIAATGFFLLQKNGGLDVTADVYSRTAFK